MIAALALLLAAAAPAPSALPEALAVIGACVGRPAPPWSPRLLARRAGIDEAGWQAACAEARRADEARRTAVKTVLRTGDAPFPAFAETARQVQDARRATDPLLGALHLQVARDLAPRESLPVGREVAYAQGLSPLARELVSAIASQEAIDADAAARAWLEPVVVRRGWFTRSRDGDEADRAAWFIVQHADMDVAFKARMLKVLEPLADSGETSPKAFASLYDRYAAEAGLPGRFGLQGHCTARGVWTPRPVEAPETVDARLAKAGFRSAAAYAASMSASCAGAQPAWWAPS